MEYNKEQKQYSATPKIDEVMEFYRNSTPKQHQYFLNLISDKLVFFNPKKSEEYEVDNDHFISFNGVYHQINIK